MRVNPDLQSSILAGIWQTQEQEHQALAQLSSGMRVNRPSDDPVAAGALVQNLASASRNDQYVQNVSSIQSLMQAADSALSSTVTSLTQAVTLGVQGANDTLSASDRQQIAQQLQGIQNSLLQAANLSVNGHYLFAGTATTTAPFALDSTAPDGVRYNGNSGTNSVTIADGRSIQVNLPGDQIFQHPGADVMGSLQQLINAMQSGTSTDISNATTQLRGALDYVSTARVFYGNGMSQLNDDSSFLQQQATNIKTQENTLVGVDMAQAITNLTKAQTDYQATLAAAGRVLPISLLDYLK